MTSNTLDEQGYAVYDNPDNRFGQAALALETDCNLVRHPHRNPQSKRMLSMPRVPPAMPATDQSCCDRLFALDDTVQTPKNDGLI